ncbi:MAG: hypothetical protein KAY24_20045 [Candidatus Eisenbacteria sp.]|nr:hypothetical protein [Candidatus Eisenbacteria bacterium]
MVHEEEHVEVISVDSIEPGEARVSVGHDLKLWASEDTGGLTAGCAVNVEISCMQGFEAMSLANDVVSDLAIMFLERNLHRAREMVKRFKDEDRRR